jgi:hypothetical protein
MENWYKSSQMMPGIAVIAFDINRMPLADNVAFGR